MKLKEPQLSKVQANDILKDEINKLPIEDFKYLTEIMKIHQTLEDIFKKPVEDIVEFALINRAIQVIFNCALKLTPETYEVFKFKDLLNDQVWLKDLRATLVHKGFDRQIKNLNSNSAAQVKNVNFENLNFYHFFKNNQSYVIKEYQNIITPLVKNIHDNFNVLVGNPEIISYPHSDIIKPHLLKEIKDLTKLGISPSLEEFIIIAYEQSLIGSKFVLQGDLSQKALHALYVELIYETLLRIEELTIDGKVKNAITYIKNQYKVARDEIAHATTMEESGNNNFIIPNHFSKFSILNKIIQQAFLNKVKLVSEVVKEAEKHEDEKEFFSYDEKESLQKKTKAKKKQTSQNLEEVFKELGITIPAKTTISMQKLLDIKKTNFEFMKLLAINNYNLPQVSELSKFEKIINNPNFKPNVPVGIKFLLSNQNEIIDLENLEVDKLLETQEGLNHTPLGHIITCYGGGDKDREITIKYLKLMLKKSDSLSPSRMSFMLDSAVEYPEVLNILIESKKNVDLSETLTTFFCYLENINMSSVKALNKKNTEDISNFNSQTVMGNPIMTLVNRMLNLLPTLDLDKYDNYKLSLDILIEKMFNPTPKNTNDNAKFMVSITCHYLVMLEKLSKKKMSLKKFFLKLKNISNILLKSFLIL